jgi:hypothetical protein
VTWPPDERGDLDGIGLDRTAGSGGAPGTYRVITPRGPAGEVTDIMSYCNPTELTEWISVRHWNSWDNIFPDGIPGGSIGAGPPSEPGPTLHVSAVVDAHNGARFLSVKPRASGMAVNADSKSPYTVVVRSAEGEIISSTPMAASFVHGHEDGMSLSFITGEVPAEKAATLELVSKEKTLASRARSQNPPKVAFKGDMPQKFGPDDFVNVSWVAADADGDRLTATIEYSSDDGESYRTLSTGIERTEFRVPVSALAPSDRARLRVTVNDGFDEQSAVTTSFPVPPTRPKVNIVEPRSQQMVRADVSIFANGEGWDDAGNYLTGKSLRWSENGEVIAIGNEVDLPPLAPGVHTIALDAEDSSGMIGHASVSIIVLPVSPMLTSFEVVKSAGDVIAISASANVAATLSLGSQSCDVGPAPRLCEFKLPDPTKGTKLAFQLRAGAEQVEVIQAIP